jgi:DNA repair protein SbcD/Mre11
MFQFIHAADIHLDSPLRGLTSFDDAPVDQIRTATRRAFENLARISHHTQFANGVQPKNRSFQIRD